MNTSSHFNFSLKGVSLTNSLGIFLILLCLPLSALSIDYKDQPKLLNIIDELVNEKVYTRAELNSIFSAATFQQQVLDAMQNPAEYKLTWGKYRKLFIQDDRINSGIDFWLQYKDELDRAEQQFGVPASVIVAIIGVESKFGKYKGKHKVLDSLVTLVTGYPRRSEFFAKELKHFLILSKENRLDSTAVLGSYAGAVGFPQFIASSYRAYAVDFSGDGVTDLIGQPVDAIGSVANYFVKNGWLSGQPVTSSELQSVPEQVEQMANNKRKVQFSAAQLKGLGAPLQASVPDEEKLNVLKLNASEIVPSNADENYYIVRAGDTACRIAENLSVPCKKLIKHNDLGSEAKIYRGQRLKVPGDKKARAKVKNSKWTVDAGENEQWRYFFTHENFYVITRYNQSVLYAMAVNDLSQALDSRFQQRASK